MPETAGTFYGLTYTVGSTTEGFPAVNIETDLSTLHANLDEALQAGAESIAIAKSE